MRIIVISGFLGAGKTSLITSAANSFAADGLQTAVLENEISASGLDGTFLKKHGFRVKELSSGCICCQLQGEMRSAIEDIAQEFEPDVIFVEPSGAAAPGHVKGSLEGLACTEEIIMVAVLDARRFAESGIEQYPFIKQSIREANIVVINKIDLVSFHIAESISCSADRLNASADIITLSLKSGDNLARLTERLKAAKKCQPRPSSLYIKSSPGNHPVSVSFRGTLPNNTSHDDIEKIVNSTLDKLASELLKNGCIRIGHIKITVEKGKHFLFLSRTSFSGTNDIKGIGSYNNSDNCKITGNIIVYGLSTYTVKIISSKVFNKTLYFLTLG